MANLSTLLMKPSGLIHNMRMHWNGKGIVLSEQGKYDEAIKAFDRAIELNPQYADAWYNKGLALDHQGKYDEVIKAYDRAIKINPQHILALINKGNVMRLQGKYDEAVKLYDIAIEIDPQDASAGATKALLSKPGANTMRQLMHTTRPSR